MVIRIVRRAGRPWLIAEVPLIVVLGMVFLVDVAMISTSVMLLAENCWLQRSC